MSRSKILGSALTAAVVAVSAHGASAAVIAGWGFDSIGVQAAPYNAPVANQGADSGVAAAKVLGMTNNYQFSDATNSVGSTDWADVTAQAGASTGSGSFAWRVRGGITGAGAPNSGWNTAAPIGTQGAEFDASTAGFNNIQVSFDLYFTTQAPAKMQLQYTTNGTTWTNASQLTYATTPGYILTNSSSSNTVNGTYFYETGGQNWYNQLSADLSGVGTAANNPKFGIRVVNAATGLDDTNSGGTAYNNSSGNVRFDNVVISGSPVPEPASLGVLALGGLVLLARRRK